MTLRPASRVARLERTLIRRIFDEAPADAINLGLGQPDLPTPPGICLAAIQAIAEGRTGYTTTAGLPELRSTVAERYPGFAEGADSVLITAGSQEAMVLAVMGLVEPGQELLYPEPGYPAYPVVAELLGATPVPYRLNPDQGFRLDAEALLARVTERTGAVLLCSPGNPTGTVHHESTLRALAEALQRRGIPWISDEIYGGFTYVRGRPPIWRIAGRGSGVVLSGLSKDYSMTGWRLGWLLGPPDLVTRLTAAHQYLVTCAPRPSQHAAVQALASASGRREGTSLRETFISRRALMAQELRKIPALAVEEPDGAFYYFVDVRRFGESLAICRRLLEDHRVVMIPGEAFGPSGAGFIRISFAAREDAIVRGVAALGRVLAEIG